MKDKHILAFLFTSMLLLASCGGEDSPSLNVQESSHVSTESKAPKSSDEPMVFSSNDSSGSATTSQEFNDAPILLLQLASVKTFRFSWQGSIGASHYKLLENPDGISGFSQIGNDFSPDIRTYDHVVPLYKRLNARYILKACSVSSGIEHCEESRELQFNDALVDAIGYFKASNTGDDDRFGQAVSISNNGNTLAIGAPFEDSNATGVNGTQKSNDAPRSGAVYVFTRSQNVWSQQAYIKASNSESNDRFGHSLSLSGDGYTLAVGAYLEDSNAVGVDGDQTNNTAARAGAVYVFKRNTSTWLQQAYVKASNTASGDLFGYALSLNDNGNTLAIGAYFESSDARGINGDQNNDIARSAGAVYVFTLKESTWSQQAYIKASNADRDDYFGYALSLSANGNTLAVGAYQEASNATGINGDQDNNSAPGSGAVYVFTRNRNVWSQQAYIKSSNTGRDDYFGYALSLSNDGNILAVGAYFEASNATGINGDQSNNDAIRAGAVYIFARNAHKWSQQAYVKASNTDAYDFFGASLSLSGDGNMLAVGAYFEASNATGINGGQDNNSAIGSGAVYIFTRSANVWTQQAYVKASNTEDRGDRFSRRALAISGDSNTMVVGAYFENSNATGIDGDQHNNDAEDISLPLSGAGAVYLY